MSYINKKGKTASSRAMIVRQQASDMVSYHEIRTTLTKAKATQKRVERLVTWAKTDTLANRRLAARWLTKTQKLTAKQAVQHLFGQIGPAFANRAGGYTRVLKLGKRAGDATEMAILQFVQAVPGHKPAKQKKQPPAKKSPIASGQQ